MSTESELVKKLNYKTKEIDSLEIVRKWFKENTIFLSQDRDGNGWKSRYLLFNGESMCEIIYKYDHKEYENYFVEVRIMPPTAKIPSQLDEMLKNYDYKREYK